MRENQWLRAKTDANLKPELKMNVVWNTCDKELPGEMKSAYEAKLRTPKVHFKTSKSHPFSEKIM